MVNLQTQKLWETQINVPHIPIIYEISHIPPVKTFLFAKNFKLTENYKNNLLLNVFLIREYILRVYIEENWDHS